MMPLRAVHALIVFIMALAAAALAPAARADTGYQEAAFVDAQGATVPVAIWYPSSAAATDSPLGLFRQSVARDGAVAGRRLPLIVISHGTGGTKDGHYDTALALARAGFVVAALEHPGDNYRDQSRAVLVTRRPAALSRLIDFMTANWGGGGRIDPRRIGAFGFSAGGFTVLAAAGGQPDFATVGPHCVAYLRNFDCLLLKRGPLPDAALFEPVTPDRRIRALVVAAPALGFTFVGHLRGVTQPVQLWRADQDTILPAPDYADAVDGALPRGADFQTVPGAGHFDFLAPCSDQLRSVAPMICTSAAGFDRAAFHERFNRAVTAFFSKTLR